MRIRLLAPALAILALACNDSTGPKPDEVVSVVAGNEFSCALVGESVYCWGKNDFGQLGRATVGPDAGPGLVTGNHRFRLLAASDRTVCGVTTAGNVMCWGHGRLFGNGEGSTSTPLSSPTLIQGTFPTTIASIGVGYGHGCVRAADGAAMCFGTNSLGEIGNGTVQPNTVSVGATAVTGGHTFSQLAVGAFHSCGLESGDVWCWGTNFSGSFGPDKAASATFSTPVQVTLAFDAAQVFAGSGVTCALNAATQASCWGVNVSGQLGRGPGSASTSSSDPAIVSAFANYTSLAMPNVNRIVTHVCGLTAAGGTNCWGAADASQLGRAPSETCTVGGGLIDCGPTPAAVETGLQFKQVTLGRNHTCGLTVDGKIYCWGSNERRQLGGPVSANTATPVLVTLPE